MNEITKPTQCSHQDLYPHKGGIASSAIITLRTITDTFNALNVSQSKAVPKSVPAISHISGSIMPTYIIRKNGQNRKYDFPVSLISSLTLFC